jgi:hypothetical protein
MWKRSRGAMARSNARASAADGGDLVHGKRALSKALVNVFVTGLRSVSPVRRRRSARSLGGLGHDALAAVSCLEVALEDNDRRVRREARGALRRRVTDGKRRGESGPPTRRG